MGMGQSDAEVAVEMSMSGALRPEDMEELEALMRETNKERGLVWQEGGWGYLTLESPNLKRVRSNGAYSPLQICLWWT